MYRFDWGLGSNSSRGEGKIYDLGLREDCRSGGSRSLPEGGFSTHRRGAVLNRNALAENRRRL